MPFETSTADNRVAPPGIIWRPSGDVAAPIGAHRPLVWNPFDMAGQRHLLPITAAILRALALPADTIIRTAAQPPTDMLAVEVVIYRMVASAIAGDTKAAALIADRVEGPHGLAATRRRARRSGHPPARTACRGVTGAIHDRARRERAYPGHKRHGGGPSTMSVLDPVLAPWHTSLQSD